MSLTTQQAEVLARLYQGTVDDSAWDQGLIGIAALVGGEGPLLMSSRKDTGVLTRYCLYSYDRAVFAEYDRSWLPHDVRVPVAARRPELSMWTEASLVGRREWSRTPIFNEFLKPNDAPWVLAGSLHSDVERFTLLCIQGTRRRGAFGPDDAGMVLPLLPHLRRALEIKDRFERNQLRGSAMRDVWDRLPFGFMMLDAQQRVLEASSFAADVIGSLNGSTLRKGERLRLPEPAQRELSALLVSGLARGRLSDGLLHVSRGWAHLPVSILSVPAAAAMEAWIHPTPRWVLLVFDPERKLVPSAAMVEQDLGLSRREAQIVALLAAGLRPPQIARRLGISLNTLRTHLKACFSKTGCHSQAELLRRVAAGPGWLRATRPATHS